MSEWLVRLAALFSAAVMLIQKGVRRPATVETLLRALQLFKENRLGGVVSLDARRSDVLPENVCELLSLKIEDLTIGARTKAYFRGEGVMYVGEVFAYFEAGGGGAKALMELQECLLAIGLTLNLDPLKLGWVPPYWDDPEILSALNLPLLNAIREEDWFHLAEEKHKRGIHYLGEMWVRPDWDQYYVRRAYERGLTPEVRLTGVHAWMFLPPGWTAPQGEPAVWPEYLERAERERVHFRAKQAQEEERRRVKPTPTPDLLLRSVDDLELSVRSANAIQNQNIYRIGDLVQWSVEQMLATRNFGRKTIKEIRSVLEDLGLRLGMDASHPLVAQFISISKPD